MGKLKWQNTALKPEESFEKGEYEELIKYVEENEHVLHSEFFYPPRKNPYFETAISDDLGLTVKYGHSKLNYFEEIIKKNPMFYALFKLGELRGQLNFIGHIRYEKDKTTLAMQCFYAIRAYYSEYSILFCEILKHLYVSGEMPLTELAKTLNSDEEIVRKAFLHLNSHSFVSCHNEFKEKYALSDSGIRVAKKLMNH